MALQTFTRNDTASFPRIVEENLSMLEETYEGTVLHLATQRGYEVDAKKLIELCPFLVTSTNSRGDTPLHLAAKLGHTSILTWMLESICMKSRNTIDDPKLSSMMNKDGLTPLHCAVMKGSVEIIREFLDKSPSAFYSVTLGNNESVFHIAARHKNKEAFIFMAKSTTVGQLVYKLDVDGNTVLHVAASVGSLALVKYITEETKIEITSKNKMGFVAVDMLPLNEDDGDFLELSTALKCDLEIVIGRPSTPKVMGKVLNQVTYVDIECKKRQREMIRVQSCESLRKKFEMQLEALQSARTTLTIVAVLIASVTFTCGINPPGGVNQEGQYIGKSTVGRTLAFTIFSISNSIALFTSMCMVILLLSFIPYEEEALSYLLVVANWMMWAAVAAMTTAYVAAASITLPHFGETKWLLYATLAIACFTLGGMFVYLRFKLAKCNLRRMNFCKCLSHESPVRNCGINMAANIAKGYYVTGIYNGQ